MNFDHEGNEGLYLDVNEYLDCSQPACLEICEGVLAVELSGGGYDLYFSTRFRYLKVHLPDEIMQGIFPEDFPLLGIIKGIFLEEEMSTLEEAQFITDSVLCTARYKEHLEKRFNDAMIRKPSDLFANSVSVMEKITAEYLLFKS